MELDREIVSVAMVVAPLAALSARLLPGMAEWPRIHWMKMEGDMEVMELWIENVQEWDEMRALHKDPLSVQKSMENEDGWHWWKSRIVQIPWKLLPLHRSW